IEIILDPSQEFVVALGEVQNTILKAKEEVVSITSTSWPPHTSLLHVLATTHLPPPRLGHHSPPSSTSWPPHTSLLHVLATTHLPPPRLGHHSPPSSSWPRLGHHHLTSLLHVLATCLPPPHSPPPPPRLGHHSPPSSHVLATTHLPPPRIGHHTPPSSTSWPPHTSLLHVLATTHLPPPHKELINDMIVPLLHQWTKANALFKPPVINQCRTIELKLTKLWHKAVETSLGKGNLARKNEFLHTLDTLFDILTCKCSIQLCSESNCSHSGKRENNSHIDCGCPREKKIPVLELEFIKAQRTKAEGQGSMQMGSIDYSETKKQIANAKKREQIREREQKKKMKSEEAIQREEELCQDVYHFFDIPPINVNATKLSELVDLSLEVLEPPLTTSLTSQELRNLKETPMQVPKWPSHTQSVERCVKMVTEAAGHVYSHERR
ncbi:hypothetical protein Hamer_G028665, partial [Homarus americanus]